MLCYQVHAKVKQEGTGLYAEPLYCRSWRCECCQKRRARELRWLAKAGEPTSFLTLTVNSKRDATPDERAQKLRTAWRALRAAMRRKFPGHGFPFIAVFEATRRGEPHLHILFRGPFVPQQWISDRMRKLIGAPIIDIRYVKDQGRAAAYVAKYLGKAPTIWEGCKRYWRSQDWQLVPDDPQSKSWSRLWIVCRGVQELFEDIRTTGTSHCDLVQRGTITFSWWTGQWREGQ